MTDSTGTSCTTTTYTDYVCFGSTGGGDPTSPPSDGGGGGGGTISNPADINEDGIIDHWKNVIQTTDPCSENFDRNDRLGTDFGGTNTDRPGHTGVDIQANLGDKVAAVRDGEITFVGWQSRDHSKGCGFHIRVVHPNQDSSIYCHLIENSNTFNVGDTVSAGTVIGSANSTGNSTGHHVHVTYNSKQTGQREEYYYYSSNTPPSSSNLDPDGC